MNNENLVKSACIVILAPVVIGVAVTAIQAGIGIFNYVSEAISQKIENDQETKA